MKIALTLNDIMVDTVKREGIGDLQEGASEEVSGTADAAIPSPELRGEG